MKIFVRNHSIVISGIADHSGVHCFPVDKISFYIDENGALLADQAGHLTVISLGVNAVEDLCLIRKKIRAKSRTDKIKVIMKGILSLSWLALFIAFILSINGMFTNYMTIIARNIPSAAVTDLPTDTHNIFPPVPQAPPQSTASPEKMLKALKNAVDAKKFTVTLSSGKTHTLYVFSDPLCPHCRNFEKKLSAVSELVNIEIFPVSVIGGEQSEQRIAAVLGENNRDTRKSRWETVMTTDNKLVSSNLMSDEINANNTAFQMLGFSGTPTVLSDSGFIVPLELFDTPDKLLSLLNDAKSGEQDK